MVAGASYRDTKALSPFHSLTYEPANDRVYVADRATGSFPADTAQVVDQTTRYL